MSDSVFSGSKLAKGAVGSIDNIARTQEFPWNQEHLLNQLDLQSYYSLSLDFFLFFLFLRLGLPRRGPTTESWNVPTPCSSASGHYDAQLTAVPEFGLGHQADWPERVRPVFGWAPVFCCLGALKGRPKTTPPILGGPPHLETKPKAFVRNPGLCSHKAMSAN